jgi:Zn-dependent protease with chaperone function
MKFGQYVSLIQRLEKFAAENPRAYRTRVLLLIVLGYAYFVGLIILLFLPIVFVGALLFVAPEAVWRIVLLLAKLWWAVLPGIGVYFGFIGSAVKSITSKVPDPPAKELPRSGAPELYDFVAKTCRELRAQKPARILVNDQFNAAVVTMPRFGIFGRKVLLLVGLPLMRALSPDQLKATIAHEIGHISGKHGAFSKWAYQMREAWGRLIDSQELTGQHFAGLYKGFVSWFFPYFTAYSFVLMREHEKDADRDAVLLTGSKALGEALILLETKGRLLDEVFWRSIHEENLANETPSGKLFSRMLDSLSAHDPDRASNALAQAMTVPTDFNDSHPSLAERLSSIAYSVDGGVPRVPAAADENAAEHFLKNGCDLIIGEYDYDWDEQAEKEWRKRHEHFSKSQKRITELNAKTDELSRDELLELAQRQAERDGLAATLPILESINHRFPDDAVVLYNLGGLRLSMGNESGLHDLDRAAELDASYKYAVNDLAFNYLRSKGRIDEAQTYASAIDEQNEIFEKARQERQFITPRDHFSPHDLSNAVVELIPQKLVGLEEITAIYLVKKDVHYMPEHPFRVLFLSTRRKGAFSKDLTAAELIEIAAKRLNGSGIDFFEVLSGSLDVLQPELDKIPGAKISP